jgi:hypothetical protein
VPRSSRPRTATVDGEDVVLLSPEEFQKLDGFRRQSGAQAMRLRSLNLRVTALQSRLDDVRVIAESMPPCSHPACPAGCGCARGLLLAAAEADRTT